MNMVNSKELLGAIKEASYLYEELVEDYGQEGEIYLSNLFQKELGELNRIIKESENYCIKSYMILEDFMEKLEVEYALLEKALKLVENRKKNTIEKLECDIQDLSEEIDVVKGLTTLIIGN